MVEWTSFRWYTSRAEANTQVLEQKMEELKEKEEEIQRSEILSLVIETALESNFQFWFQTQYILPAVVTNILEYFNGELNITELINWRTLSIFLSFISISWTAVKIRQVFSSII